MKKKLNSTKIIMIFSFMLILSSFTLTEDPPTIIAQGYTHDYTGFWWDTIIPNKYRRVTVYSNQSQQIEYFYCAQDMYFSCLTDQCLYPDSPLMCPCPKDESDIENP